METHRVWTLPIFVRSRTYKTQLGGEGEFYDILPKISYKKKMIFYDGFLRANHIRGCFWIARAVIFRVIRGKRLPAKGRRTVIRAKLWRSHYEFRFSKHVHRSPRVKARRVARYVRRNRYKILPAEKFHSGGLVCYRRIVFFFFVGPDCYTVLRHGKYRIVCVFTCLVLRVA